MFNKHLVILLHSVCKFYSCMNNYDISLIYAFLFTSVFARLQFVLINKLRLLVHMSAVRLVPCIAGLAVNDTGGRQMQKDSLFDDINQAFVHDIAVAAKLRAQIYCADDHYWQDSPPLRATGAPTIRVSQPSDVHVINP